MKNSKGTGPYSRVPDPTPQEIRDQRAEIQARRSSSEKAQRAGQVRQPIIFPMLFTPFEMGRSILKSQDYALVKG